ncbi:hypothetical protein POVCU1_053030 [Plasmodium ovale curtisi]|uniref:Uncharacterized protein n=1 Tax=Plasmodium ovale curtisi TaxID=864141 RepID=A0A1A8X5K2_PLAOA|nr:hypothetical protein POVCU1_053030 [Plasmodium ovale curtisi]
MNTVITASSVVDYQNYFNCDDEVNPKNLYSKLKFLFDESLKNSLNRRKNEKEYPRIILSEQKQSKVCLKYHKVYHRNGKILKRMKCIDEKGDIKSIVLGNISNTEDITQSITDY